MGVPNAPGEVPGMTPQGGQTGEDQPPVADNQMMQALLPLFQQKTGVADEGRAAVMLGKVLEDAGIGQQDLQQNDQALNELVETLDNLPNDMALSKSQGDAALAKKIKQIAGGQAGGQQGGLQDQTMSIVQPMMPYLMAFKVIDAMMGGAFGSNQQEQQGTQNELMEKLQERMVQQIMGEQQQQQSGEVATLRRDIAELKGRLEDRGEQMKPETRTQLEQEIDRLSKTYDKIEQLANKAGYKKGDDNLLNKVGEIVGDVDNVLDKAGVNPRSPQRQPKKANVEKIGENENPIPNNNTQTQENTPEQPAEEPEPEPSSESQEE